MSPVIAVILMVAITVVLAATVFVLVNDLGKNVGTTGPSLGMVTDAAGSSNSAWTVKTSSATQLADLTDYKFVVTTPSNGTLVMTPASSTFTAGETQCALAPADDAARKEFAACATTNAADFKVIISDVDGNAKYSVGDTVKITYDRADPNALFGDAFPSGQYSLEILHTQSGTSAGSLPRTFG